MNELKINSRIKPLAFEPTMPGVHRDGIYRVVDFSRAADDAVSHVHWVDELMEERITDVHEFQMLFGVLVNVGALLDVADGVDASVSLVFIGDASRSRGPYSDMTFGKSYALTPSSGGNWVNWEDDMGDSCGSGSISVTQNFHQLVEIQYIDGVSFVGVDELIESGEFTGITSEDFIRQALLIRGHVISTREANKLLQVLEANLKLRG